MSDTSFRAELEIGSSEVVEAKAKVAELQAQLGSLKASEAERVQQVELETMALEHLIETMRFEQAELAKLEAARDAEVAAIGRQVAAQLKAAEKTERSEFAHQVELETMALEHEIATLAHEAEQLAATRAAEDALVAAVEQSIGADLAASDATEALTADRAAANVTLAKEIDFERLDTSVKAQEALAARELADAEMDAATAAKFESTVLMAQAQALDHVADEVGQLNAAFGRGEIGIHEYDFAIRQLDGSNLKLVNTSTAAAAALVRGAKGTANYGLAALEASRGLEDMQYGFGGVINNIPNLTMLLGGTGGLAAGISAVSVGAYILYQHWDDVTGLFQSRNPFPSVAGSLEDLDAALKKNNKELDDLREKSSLSNDQLERANFLIAEQTRLEAEQEAAHDIKKMKQTKSEQQNAQADEFKKIVDKIGGPQALADVQKAVAEKYPGRGEQADRSTAEALLRGGLQGNSASRDELEQLFLGGYGKGTKFGTQMMGGPNVAPLPGEPIHFDPETRKRLDKLRKDDEEREKRELGKADKIALDTHLDEMKARGSIGKVADQLVDEAKKKGLAGNAAFDHIEKGLQDAIKGGLEVRGFKPPLNVDIGLDKAVGDAALAATKKALADDSRDEKKADKKEDKTDHAAAVAASKAGAHQAGVDFKFHQDQEAAAARRIVDAFGKQAVEAFEAEIKASMLPAEQAAKNLVAVLTQQLVDAGARFTVANRAARDVAKKAGFEVEAPKELAGPPVPVRGPVAEGIAAARKALAPEHAKERRRVLAEQEKARKLAQANARKAKLNRPKAGKTPMPKVAANAAPKPVLKTQGNPTAQAAPVKPKPPAGPQAALDKTLDVTAKTQDAIAAGQTIDHQLLTRLSVLERRTATLEGTNKSLMNRAMESAPTASNSGGSIA